MSTTITKQWCLQRLQMQVVISEDDAQALIEKNARGSATKVIECRGYLGNADAVGALIGAVQNGERIYIPARNTHDDASSQTGDLHHGAAPHRDPTQTSTTDNTSRQQSSSSQEQSQTLQEQQATWIAQGKNILINTGLIIAGIVGMIIVTLMIRWMVRFLYDVLNAGRMMTFKITLPRGDSKVDRDREKEVAKDMKEKIGRMAQVYRNIHNIGELSAIDTIQNFLFRKSKVTFTMHYEDGTLGFYLTTYPEYAKTIEAAVAAQYPEASLEEVANVNIEKYKHFDLIPLQPVKDPVYPIRIYKQLEDDPLNNIVDAIAKVSSEDTFSMVMVLKPRGDGFNKKAQRVAEGLFKREIKFTNPKPMWQKVVFWPIFLIDFLIHGFSDNMVSKMTAPGASSGDAYIRMVKAEEDALNTMGEEAGKPAFDAGLYIVSSSKVKDRVSANMRNAVSAFTIYKDEYNNELDQPELVADMFGFILNRFWRIAVKLHLIGFFARKNVFSVDELSSIYHLPDGVFNRSPAIVWMDYKMLNHPQKIVEPTQPNGRYLDGIIAESYKGGNISDIFAHSKNKHVTAVETTDEHGVKKTTHGIRLYHDAILLGVNVYRNKYVPIYMNRDDRTRHHYIIGKSGSGKSVYIDMLARQDIRNGDGVCVIDPHGDLVESILEYIPKERAKDVIYFDAGNEERPMGLNLYEIDSRNEADRVVNDATETFIKMFGPEIFGPRIQEYFKFGSLTLLDDLEDPATLLDVPRLYTDESYREYKTKKVTNPVVRNFREKTYNAMGDREKQEIIPYFTSKFVSFNTNSLIRNIIGQTKSGFNFRDVMDNQKILLINLSKGKIGELNAQLLGMIMVSKIYNGAMARADTAQADRKDFFLYVDEFQNFVTETFKDILSEARKYRLALIMAHQYISQLDSNAGNNIGEKGGGIKDAVFGNVGTMQSFKVGAPDAEFLEKEYAPVLSGQDILGISNYKTYTKLNINNSTSRPFSLNSIYTKTYRNKKAPGILKEYSAKKYGRKKEFVEAEIEARLGVMEDTSVVDELPHQPQGGPGAMPGTAGMPGMPGMGAMPGAGGGGGIPGMPGMPGGLPAGMGGAGQVGQAGMPSPQQIAAMQQMQQMAQANNGQPSPNASPGIPLGTKKVPATQALDANGQPVQR